MAVFSASYPGFTVDDLASIRKFVETSVAALGGDEDAVGELVMAVNEAAANIAQHGYYGRPGWLGIDLSCRENSITARLRDKAPGFDPTRVPVVNVKLPLHERRRGGLGVLMMRAFTDQLLYRQTAAGENELSLIKSLPQVAR